MSSLGDNGSSMMSIPWPDPSVSTGGSSRWLSLCSLSTLRNHSQACCNLSKQKATPACSGFCGGSSGYRPALPRVALPSRESAWAGNEALSLKATLASLQKLSCCRASSFFRKPDTVKMMRTRPTASELLLDPSPNKMHQLLLGEHTKQHL